MMLRVLLLVFVVAVGFGQMGRYEPISSHVKAGDLAPEIKGRQDAERAGCRFLESDECFRASDGFDVHTGYVA